MIIYNRLFPEFRVRKFSNTLTSNDKDSDLRFKDQDKDIDLKISRRGSSNTRTFLEGNNTAKQITKAEEDDINLWVQHKL